MATDGTNSKNLGQVVGLHIGTTAPENTNLIWFDSSSNQNCHKVYDFNRRQWVSLNPQIVQRTTYAELKSSAQRNGLPVGQFYNITQTADFSDNVLALAVASTKVQYVDKSGNIVVDDLSSNKQFHVGSGNLLWDGLTGTFTANQLRFDFTTVTSLPNGNGMYFYARRGNTLIKFLARYLISTTANNALSWSRGIYFNFTTAINGIKNRVGGIVGYDLYKSKVNSIDIAIQNVSRENQSIVSVTNTNLNNATSDSAIYGKKMPNAPAVSSVSGDVARNDTLFNAISKLQKWINQFKYATGVKLSSAFADATSQQYINSNDTVQSAFSKVQYMLKNPTTVYKLPAGWTANVNYYKENGLPSAGDTIGVAFSKIVSYLKDPTSNIKLPESFSPGGYFSQGFPAVGDSMYSALSKITDFLMSAGKNVKLPSDWTDLDYSQTISLPTANETFDYVIKKLVAKLNQIGSISYNGIESKKTVSHGGYIRSVWQMNVAGPAFALYNTGYSLQLYPSEIVSQNSNSDDVFRINHSGMKLEGSAKPYDSLVTMPGSTSGWSTVDVSALFKYNGTAGYSAALSARNAAQGSTAFDAVFNRLLVGRLTFNFISITNAYSVADKMFILNNTSGALDVYLPANPASGTVIFAMKISNDGNLNMLAQGGNGIDTIGEARGSVTLNKRGQLYMFVFVSDVKYTSSEYLGLWSYMHMSAE